MSNIVYPWKNQRKEHAWFQAEWKQVEKLKCFHGCGDGQEKLFLVLFILVINAYYLLSRQCLMFVFKGLRDDSTRAQLDLIISDLHMTQSEEKLKLIEINTYDFSCIFSDRSDTFPTLKSEHVWISWVLHSVLLQAVLSMQNLLEYVFCVVWLKDLVSEVSLTKKVQASSWPEWITFSVSLLQIRLPILLVMSTEWRLPRSGRPWKGILLRLRESIIWTCVNTVQQRKAVDTSMTRK